MKFEAVSNYFTMLNKMVTFITLNLDTFNLVL